MNSKDIEQQGLREVSRMVDNYTSMRTHSPHMYEETMWQYADMATGGTGDPTNFKNGKAQSTIRDEYYPGYPDMWFFQVLSALGEFERYTALITKED